MASKDLIIDAGDTEVSLALLEDKQLIELNKEKRNIQFSVGDIYLGKVKKIMPGLNAAFINVGYERDAFLHYLDLGAQFRSLHKYYAKLFARLFLNWTRNSKRCVLRFNLRRPYWLAASLAAIL